MKSCADNVEGAQVGAAEADGSPGAPREEYFERVAEMAQRGGEEFGEFLVRHDSFFV